MTVFVNDNIYRRGWDRINFATLARLGRRGLIIQSTSGGGDSLVLVGNRLRGNSVYSAAYASGAQLQQTTRY